MHIKGILRVKKLVISPSLIIIMGTTDTITGLNEKKGEYYEIKTCCFIRTIHFLSGYVRP